MPSLPRGRYQLKMATTREELDENNTSKTNSRKATQLFRKTTDNIKSFKESGSQKDSKNEQFSLDLKSTWEPQKQEHQNSYSLNSNLDEADTGEEGLEKQRTSYKLTSTLSSSSNPKRHYVNSREAGTSSNSSVRPMGEENSVGKSFKDTFAFLKNTRHYEEAEAKMKEIESAKPATVTKITAPNKPKPNAIQVNPRQKGNPVLKFIRCVPWEYSDIVPDYVMGGTTCALFLSLRYHHFNPNYIHERLRLLGKSYELRILLVLVDVKDPHQTLRELAKMAIMADLTLVLTWSSEEAGKYLETYKVYENKPVDALQGQNDRDYFSRLQDCLTTVKGINKTDVLTLNSTFGSLAEITKAPKDDLVFLPGFGPLKAKRLQNIFHEPFLAKKKKSETASSAEKPN